MKHKHKREKYLILIHFDKIRRSKSPTEFQGEIQMIEHHKKQQIIAMKSNRSNWLSSNWFKPGNKPNNYWYKSLIQAKPSVTSWKLIGINCCLALWARRRFDENATFLQYCTQWIFVLHPYCVYFLVTRVLAITKNDPSLQAHSLCISNPNDILITGRNRVQLLMFFVSAYQF